MGTCLRVRPRQSAALPAFLFLLSTLLQGLFGALSARAQTPEYRFEHFPELGVISWFIHQDSQGFLWIASWEGLFRYDGYTFKGYFHTPGDTTTLSSNNVFRAYEDRAGTLWVQTIGTGQREGLHRYDRKTDTFARLTTSVDSLGGRNARVNSFFEDREGTLWLGSEKGLFRYDRQTQTFARHSPASGVLEGVSVQAIHEGRDGALWLGVYGQDPNSMLWNTGPGEAEWRREEGAGGLIRLERDRTTYRRFVHDSADPQSIGPGGVGAILEDSRGRLWVGTAEGGLCRMDRAKEAFSCYRHDTADPESVSHDNITSLAEDDAGMLWVGTDGGGLNRFDPERGRFEHFTWDPDRPAHTVPGGDIEHVYRDRTGVLWIATWGGGLSKLSRSTPLFTTYTPPARDPMIGGVLEDRAGRVWIGTGDGLHRLDRETGRWTSFRPDPGTSGSLSASLAAGMHEGRTGVLWVSRGPNGGQVLLADSRSAS